MGDNYLIIFLTITTLLLLSLIIVDYLSYKMKWVKISKIFATTVIPLPLILICVWMLFAMTFSFLKNY